MDVHTCMYMYVHRLARMFWICRVVCHCLFVASESQLGRNRPPVFAIAVPVLLRTPYCVLLQIFSIPLRSVVRLLIFRLFLVSPKCVDLCGPRWPSVVLSGPRGPRSSVVAVRRRRCCRCVVDTIDPLSLIPFY
jgi:hypothetical protein